MSLSITLIPIAIAIGSVASYAFQEKVEEGTYYQIETSIKDETILQEALKNYGCEVTLDEISMESQIGNIQIAFHRQENETISAIFHKNVPTMDAEQFVQNIYNEYTRIVQENTYEKLMERAKEAGLQLESEHRNEEETIVLTFQVKE